MSKHELSQVNKSAHLLNFLNWIFHYNYVFSLYCILIFIILNITNILMIFWNYNIIICHKHCNDFYIALSFYATNIVMIYLITIFIVISCLNLSLFEFHQSSVETDLIYNFFLYLKITDHMSKLYVNKGSVYIALFNINIE